MPVVVRVAVAAPTLPAAERVVAVVPILPAVVPTAAASEPVAVLGDMG